MSDSEKKVLADINLNHTALEEGARYLIEWISKQPHLPKVKDNEWMKAFIIGSKSIERAKEKLDRYYTCRAKYPEIYFDRDPLTLNWKAIEKLVLLPGLTPDNHHVILVEPPIKQEDIDNFDYLETVRYVYLLFDYILKYHPYSSGHYLVINVKNVKMELLSKWINGHTLATFDIYQNAMPVRLRAFILINSTSIVETFMNTFKFFLTPKLRERVYVHSDNEKVLSKYFPLDLLPEDYGGNSPSFESLVEMTKKQLESERKWFLNEGSQKTDLSKRPKNDENNMEQVQGTFRKLELD